jgi:predicted extracellular nuclease
VKRALSRLATCLALILAFAVWSGNALAAGDVVISQVYGAGGNSGAVLQNDYVELFNRGSVDVPLSGLSIQYASATGTGQFGATTAAITPLTGTLAPGRYLLVREATGGAVGGPVGTDIDDGTPIAMAAGAGKVALVSSTSSLGCNGGATPCNASQLAQIIDLVGYGTGASGANFFEGSGPAPTINATLADFRAGVGCTDTDSNAADFSAATPAPRSLETAPHPCGVVTDAAPSVTSTSPANAATGVAADANLTVTFSEAVATAGDWFSIVCSSSGGHTAASSAALNSFTLDPAVNFSPGENCTVTIRASGVTDIDGLDPPDNMSGDYSFSFSVAAATVTLTAIHDVQGASDTSPLVGQTVTIEGVVVGDYQLSSQFSGFYVQEEDADADGNPATSEGVFVFGGGTAVNTGDVVRVMGKVSEFSGLTEIAPVTNGVSVRSTGASVTPTSVSLPVANVGDLERYEGMQVAFAQTLTVTEVFNLARFGEVSLSGAGRLYTPTAVATPGAAANAVEAQNNRSRIVLDDANGQQNIDPTLYPQGGLSATNPLRVGDSLAGLTGVLDFRFALYRIQPIGPIAFDHTNPRPTVPDPVGGNLKIASFNVLNYFNGDGTGGGFPTSRGADTPTEFQRQRAKEISALTAMNANVVGLMEMENDAGEHSAVADLVSGLNDAMGAGTYAYVDTGVIGTDEIKVALIYKPAAVTTVGDWKIIDSSVDPRFDSSKSRPSLAQTFRDNATGRKFTVVVNHLKSKSSACAGDPDTGDGSGNCNLTRTSAAAALVDWLKTDPTGSGDPDYLLIGDMNAYTFESPIQTFVDGGLTNLVRKYDGLAGYSYVFDGESGYLDHALATPSLESQVTGVGHWHINPDESAALDYNVEFKSAGQVASFYSPGPYRSSDHDPVLIGVQFADAPTANAGGPYLVDEGGSTTLAGDGTGESLTYTWDLDGDGTFETTGRTPAFSAATLDGPGSRQVALKVSDGELSDTSTATVEVANVAPAATFTASAAVYAGSPVAVALTAPTDPSTADTAAGFSYAFDCGGGTFVASSGPAATCTTGDTGTLTVRGRITDKDGGSTIYSATVSVTVTVGSLCDLTSVYVANEGVAQSLCVKLEHGSYDAYANEVAAQAGKALTVEQAATLTRLVGRL